MTFPARRPAKKKAKSTKPKATNKNKTTNKKPVLRGKAKAAFQKGFQNAPIDILQEISSHLDPKTLLALTQTCRVTRALMLDPSTAPIWKAAREREGIPELTSKAMSEIELARFLFVKTCHGCGAKGAAKVDYILLVRTCAKCWKAK